MRKRRELGRIRRGSTFERSIFRLPALFTLFGREPTDTDRGGATLIEEYASALHRCREKCSMPRLCSSGVINQFAG